ncbi:hypothetical protein BS50DRAFT_28029 [Corynespora cassiicola Philippines]|uniref:Glycosyl transferase family 25 domain-containing protein n=1 Tax=Corynespora cassiicola Philippines TaxID=1448308 RepID=A0A2T2PBC2_CORCC|nr:hypothetical protein BS50DRAFT_28029 [Corynespora cassiicola Philippines]
MSFLTMQGIRILQVLVASTVVITLFFTVSRFGSHTISEDGVSGGLKNHVPDSLSKASLPFGSRVPEPKPANETLDFQEIIYLSMPYRTDRQDALSLIAAVAGLKLTMMPGVSADEIHPKAQPPHIGNNDMNGTAALGIWRAHANVWRHIIDNNIQSALIIEDDVDFDVNIKQIMGTLNWQLRYNNTIRWGKDVDKGWKEECPYGCDWDELFVGQCGGKPNRERLDLHQVYNEPNGPPLSTLHPWVKREFTQIWNLTESDGIRVIAPTFTPVCLMGYGVSRMGAMRMLYQIGGWRPFGHPVDNEIAFRTKEGVLSGYTMQPPAFVTWRVGGAQDSDNDAIMNAQEVNTKGNMDGKSQGLKNSIRKSLPKVFEKNYWKDMENELR